MILYIVETIKKQRGSFYVDTESTIHAFKHSMLILDRGLSIPRAISIWTWNKKDVNICSISIDATVLG